MFFTYFSEVLISVLDYHFPVKHPTLVIANDYEYFRDFLLSMNDIDIKHPTPKSTFCHPYCKR